MKNKGKQSRVIFNLLGMLLFISLWQLLVHVKQDPTLISVDKIFSSFINIIISEKFLINLLSTLKIIAIGIAISIIVGISLGVIMDLNIYIRNTMSPMIEIFRNIPSITLFPILLVALGIGDISRIFVIFWTSCPSILLSALYSLRNINIECIEAGRECGATETQIMFQIKLPLAFPNILNGIKIGIGSGFVAIVVAEMLGATKGIGYMVLWTTNAFKYSETYAYIIIIGLLGMMMNGIMQLIINKYEREL